MADDVIRKYIHGREADLAVENATLRAEVARLVAALNTQRDQYEAELLPLTAHVAALVGAWTHYHETLMDVTDPLTLHRARMAMQSVVDAPDLAALAQEAAAKDEIWRLAMAWEDDAECPDALYAAVQRYRDAARAGKP